MPTEFSPELEQFLSSEIAIGNFSDRDEVVECALRLLQRDREEAIEGIKLGLADAEAGRMQPAHEVFVELRKQSSPTNAE